MDLVLAEANGKHERIKRRNNNFLDLQLALYLAIHKSVFFV